MSKLEAMRLGLLQTNNELKVGDYAIANVEVVDSGTLFGVYCKITELCDSKIYAELLTPMYYNHELCKMIAGPAANFYKVNEVPNVDGQIIMKNRTLVIPIIKHITFNEEKGITTVIFDDDTKVMSKCNKDDHFDHEVGVAMCIAKKIYGTRAAFTREVTRGHIVKSKEERKINKEE